MTQKLEVQIEEGGERSLGERSSQLARLGVGSEGGCDRSREIQQAIGGFRGS